MCWVPGRLSRRWPKWASLWSLDSCPSDIRQCIEDKAAHLGMIDIRGDDERVVRLHGMTADRVLEDGKHVSSGLLAVPLADEECQLLHVRHVPFHHERAVDDQLEEEAQNRCRLVFTICERDLALAAVIEAEGVLEHGAES